MFKEFAVLLLEIDFILTVISFFIYLLLNNRAMYKLAFILVVAGLIGRIIHEPMLGLSDAKYFWYMVWATINLVVLYKLVSLIKESPNIQKIAIPIAFFYLMGALLYSGRHIDRLVFETNYLEKIYQVGDPALNWLIVAYLFAPIALLLVKSIKSRYSA